MCLNVPSAALILIAPFVSILLIATQVRGSETNVVSTKENEYATTEALGLMRGFPPPPDKRVDQSNAIFGVPYNRWSYQNMRRMYPSAPVRAAKQPIYLVREIDSKIADLLVKREDGSEADLRTFISETYTEAFVVLHEGKVVYERYLNGMTADTPHQMMSVTKSFAGLLALLASSEGLLSEEDLVTRWVPELTASGAFDGATVGQLLNMTSSMAFSEDYHDPESDIQQYGRVLGLFKQQVDEQLPRNLYDYLVTLQKGARGHGVQYEYQTPKADVVNWVTNRVTGLSFEEDLANRLWTRLGTDGETYVLTAICPNTKYPFLRALTTRDSEAVAEQMLDVNLDCGVVPAIHQSDNEFCNLAVSEMISLLGAVQVFSAALRPQAQGLVERIHRSGGDNRPGVQ